jgi:hypothetical protein
MSDFTDEDERERFIEALRPPTKWQDRGQPTEKILVWFMDRDDAEEMYDDHLVPLIAARDKRVRAEALREAADEVRGLAVAGEDDGNPWTPGDANTEVYNEAIRDAWDSIRARADAEESK